MNVVSVEHPELPPLQMPARFKHDVAYFMTPPGEKDAPPTLPPGEFWVNRDDAERWLADGVLLVYSPLDSTKQAEIEISAEQEEWLEWLVRHDVRHIRLV